MLYVQSYSILLCSPTVRYLLSSSRINEHSRSQYNISFLLPLGRSKVHPTCGYKRIEYEVQPLGLQILNFSICSKFISENHQSLFTGPSNGPVLFCRGRLSSVAVVCNTAGGRAGRPPGAWTVGAPAAVRVGGQAADTARRASIVTSPLGRRRHLV